MQALFHKQNTWSPKDIIEVSTCQLVNSIFNLYKNVFTNVKAEYVDKKTFVDSNTC